MNNGIRINKETFMRLEPDEKLGAIFDTLVSIHGQCICREKNCEVRFKRIENRKIRDKGIAATAGFIGGFVAHIAQKIFIGGNP